MAVHGWRLRRLSEHPIYVCPHCWSYVVNYARHVAVQHAEVQR